MSAPDAPGTRRTPIPGYPEDAERSLIGCVLLRPECAPALVADVAPADFFLPAHQRIWESVTALVAAGGALDPVLLADGLAQRGLAGQTGGLDYLYGLLHGVPTAENAPHYAAIVLRAARDRRTQLALSRAQHATPEERPKLIRRALAEAGRVKRKNGAGPPALALVPEADAQPADDAEPEPTADALPTIVLTRRDQRDVAAEAIAALAARGTVYVRERDLVRCVRTVEPDASAPSTQAALRLAAGTPVVESLSPDGLRSELAHAADWRRRSTGSDGLLRDVPADVPRWAPGMVAAACDWPGLRPLVGVVDSPVLRPDGSILAVSGYDAATALVYEPGAAFPPVPDAPTRADAIAAAGRVLALFRDFPFVADSDRFAVLALVLSIVGRPAIAGPCPMFAIRAPTPGSGKSLLARTAIVLACGRDAAVMTACRDDDEWRKRILAALLPAPAAILLDNLTGVVSTAQLAGVLTSTSFRDRMLGQSREASVPARAVWVATGNNLSFGGDLARRILPIDLDPRCEFPESRSGPDGAGWSHELPSAAFAQRPSLLVDALTILRAYHLAGRPSHGASRIGSFEAWDDLVRGAVAWIGCDPAATRQRLRDEGDADRDDLLAVLSALRAKYTGTPFTATHVAEAAREQAPNAVADALRGAAGGRDLTPHRIGLLFRRIRGRLAGGLSLLRAELDGHTKVARWRVRQGDEDDRWSGDLFAADGGEASGQTAAPGLDAQEPDNDEVPF